MRNYRRYIKLETTYLVFKIKTKKNHMDYQHYFQIYK